CARPGDDDYGHFSFDYW
nr:immunoglobulin heavy chain junction region [Macaca mulatta]MOW46374.1 immunoglobulin heavy chain junction region [Macaca mulatta]MOW46766.1 immunoglobulin heavy chain junction region [Macaca mulatta]MOW47050.1 immunoglobulin heavy chain junction region [Macaca mulatta]MOW49980.1 immunoglobulin heavy chain junction region [Macaca mulatta]